MLRDRFHYPEFPYFLSHSVGVQPKTADRAFRETFFEPWRASDSEAWTHWLNALDAHRTALAPIIGADAADICQQTNVSSALTKILFSIPKQEGRNKILLCKEDFPTIGFVLAQAEKFGFELQFIDAGAPLHDADFWRSQIDDAVHLLHVTHVFSNACVKAPVREIVETARDRGVWTIVDVAQSAGAIPVTLNDWGPDFAIGTSVKYLCGGPGAAYLWANPETTSACEPIDVGWFSHETPFVFDIEHFEYAPTAAKFWGGTPSVAPFALAAAAAPIILEAGVDGIFQHNQKLLQHLIDALPPDSFRSHTAPGERGSACIIRPAAMNQAAAALKANGVRHDERGGGFRFSVHLYNSAEEVERLAALLAPFC